MSEASDFYTIAIENKMRLEEEKNKKQKFDSDNYNNIQKEKNVNELKEIYELFKKATEQGHTYIKLNRRENRLHIDNILNLLHHKFNIKEKIQNNGQDGYDEYYYFYEISCRDGTGIWFTNDFNYFKY